jgi:NitT/TauT family transport system substrate-binding protein
MTRFRLATALLAALIAFGATGARAESIKVGISRLLGYPAVPIAIERGYFKAQGLDVEMVFFDSAQPISVGVASGDLDFGVSGMSAGFYTLAAQGQLRLIADSAGEAPGFHALAYFASPKAYAAGLTSPEDFAGHSVAVTQLGTSLHYSIAIAAQHFGYPLSAITVKPLQSNTIVLAALAGGTVDAAVLPDTTAAPAVAKGDAKFIGWVSDLATTLLSASACFTNTKSANNRSDMVKRFLVAYRQGQRDFYNAFITPDGKRQDGPTAPAIIKLMEDFTGASEAEIERTIPFLDPDGRVDVASISAQLAWYKSQNLVKGDIKAEDIVDTRYAVVMPPPQFPKGSTP